MRLSTQAGQERLLAELRVRRSFGLLEGYLALLKTHGTLSDRVIDGQIHELRTAFETLGLIGAEDKQ